MRTVLVLVTLLIIVIGCGDADGNSKPDSDVLIDAAGMGKEGGAGGNDRDGGIDNTPKYPGWCAGTSSDDVDGILKIAKREYDSDGYHVVSEIDDVKGISDQRWMYTNDENGSPLFMENDTGVNGTVDERTTYTNDANGNMITAELDKGIDGIVDERWTYTYDENGDVLTVTWDDGADGTADRRRMYTYTYDENGNILEREDENERRTYAYDAKGNLLIEAWVGGAGYGEGFNITYNYDCWEWTNGRWQYTDS